MLKLATREYVVGLLALLGLWSAPSTSTADAIAGKYALAGTAHVAISPFPAQDYPGEMTATLSRSPALDTLALRLETRGYACTLQVRLAGDGSLQFTDGATCPLEVSQPDARGHVDAKLRVARARVVDKRLEMNLQFDVNGSIQLWIPSRTIRILGAEVQTPATWAPSAPVHGTVTADGHGLRAAPPG